jgi:hypothetical protein
VRARQQGLLAWNMDTKIRLCVRKTKNKQRKTEDRRWKTKRREKRGHVICEINIK